MKPNTEPPVSRDALIESYNEFYSTPGGSLRETDSFYRWALDRLAPVPGSSLLDVACGEGHVLRFARRRGVHAFGCDLSSGATKLARRIVRAPVMLVSDGEALPFCSGSFDAVTNLGSLEHFMHPTLGIHEMLRVLRPSGRAAIFLPNSYYLADIIWSVWRTGYSVNHRQVLERFATFREWYDLLAEGGLVVEKAYKYNFAFPRSLFDMGWYRRHPLKLLPMLLGPLTPFNLSYSFLYICRKDRSA